MTIIQALARLPDDKWKLQSLQNCFLRGDVKKNSASVTFETTRELCLQLNAAAVIGKRVETMGMIIWVDTDAWDKAKADPIPVANESAVPESAPDLGFKPSELLAGYHEWVKYSESVEHKLRPETRAWLYEWRMWDLACSPMDDDERRGIRYGHYLGWHAAKNK